MQRQHRHHRHQRVAQHVVQQDARADHRPLARAVRTKSRSETSSTAVARHAEHHRGETNADGERRHRQQAEMPRGILRERHVAARRHPVQVLRENQHQQRAEHEHRHRERECRQRRRRGDRTRRRGRIAANSPAGMPSDHRDDRRSNDQFERARQARGDLAGDRRAILQ